MSAPATSHEWMIARRIIDKLDELDASCPDALPSDADRQKLVLRELVKLREHNFGEFCATLEAAALVSCENDNDRDEDAVALDWKEVAR